MTTIPDLFADLNRLNARVSARGGKLAIDAPAGVITSDIKAALAEYKAALLSSIADDAFDAAAWEQIKAINWNAPPVSEQIESGRQHNDQVRKRTS